VNSGSQLIELLRFWRNEPPLQAGWTRVPVFVIGLAGLALALGGLAYVARDALLPWISGLAGRVSPSGDPDPRIGPAMTIKAIDDQEFQIRWETGSPAIQEARSAVLAIVDSGVAQRIPLDGPHLQAAAFTFKKHSARMDFRLTIILAFGLRRATRLREEKCPNSTPLGIGTITFMRIHLVIVPQAIRSPALPAGSDFISSALA
jgi:hypothetical protein